MSDENKPVEKKKEWKWTNILFAVVCVFLVIVTLYFLGVVLLFSSIGGAVGGSSVGGSIFMLYLPFILIPGALAFGAGYLAKTL